MSGPQSKRLIVVSMLAAAIVTAARDWTAGEPLTPTRLARVLIGGVMLAVLAEFAPQLAGPLAVLLLTAALLNTGPEVYRNLSRPTSPTGDTP